MEREKVDLNKIVDDDHPSVVIEVNSLSRQLNEEESDRKNTRVYGRCGTVSVNGPKKSAKGFAEYVDIETDDVFDEPRDYFRVEDSTDMILKHLLKIRLLAKDLGITPGYLMLLEMLEKSTKGLRKKAESG